MKWTVIFLVKQSQTDVIAFGNKDEILKVNAYLEFRGHKHTYHTSPQVFTLASSYI